MCGILGSINFPFNLPVLNLLKHRGPDGHGLAHLDVGNHRVLLGHRRLSIVDLSEAGRQPMFDQAEAHALSFNGEIYNHQNLRVNLARTAYRGHSDTETILHHLKQHGAEACCDLNGIFALAYLDRDRRALYLARDPFGVKPLYYWAQNNSVLFSSELRPLRALLSDSVDMDRLAELLCLRYVPSPDTLFRNISKVRPGHLVRIDLSKSSLKLSERSFCSHDLQPTQRLTQAEAVSQYGELVEQAVRRQLMADVPVGLLLSGGVDSALIAATAQRQSGYRMKAFTVGFLPEGQEADEIRYAAETAGTLGLEHHHVRMDSNAFFDLLPRVSSIVEEPLATTSALPMFYLAQLASEHVKVVLSGQGADEAMGGYQRYRSEVLRDMIPPFLKPWVAKLAGPFAAKRDALHRALDSFQVDDDPSRFHLVYQVFSNSQIERLIGMNSTRAAEQIRYSYDLLQCAARSTGAERMMSIDLRMNLADDLLLYTDKVTMHHSLECRVPFLDLDLVRFAERLPARWRTGVVRGKRLHKAYARRVLPHSVVRRKKLGFLSPTKHWFRQHGPVWDILLNPHSRFASRFNLHEVRNILQQHAVGLNRERQIFLLLSLHCWFAEQIPSVPQTLQTSA